MDSGERRNTLAFTKSMSNEQLIFKTWGVPVKYGFHCDDYVFNVPRFEVDIQYTGNVSASGCGFVLFMNISGWVIVSQFALR